MKLSSILLVMAMLYSCQPKKPVAIKTGLEGTSMPAIDLIAFDSITHFNTTSSDPGKPTILFAFQPTCPYCRAQTRAMTSNIKLLKDVNIYMLCMGDYPSFKKYVEKYELNKYSNIKAGIDYNMTFAEHYKVASVPYIAIYDKDKKLKQVLQGKNYVSTLKDIALQ